MNSNDELKAEQDFVRSFWKSLEGSSSLLDNLTWRGKHGGLPSRFQVSTLASADCLEVLNLNIESA
jgi:hypothetical protein